ncbi:type IV pilus modification protein PilV [Ideonella oryzae]|uniref:Type IV pilus modification protein PilV n=1 Tax=Ideonella oryzae TaxID=2937441 RepID=A0ABT1BIK4_9BURK|nr:type IV pilus modification protein PilV [Ideonella oryzae]MCO5975943.1 type IV pilus modification protein PilV [Ideonella oryzae]
MGEHCLTWPDTAGSAKPVERRSVLTSGSHRRVRGATLVEVLVAILIVSIGMLAMAGLLGNATRFGKTAEFRAIATLLASDMADRMRANFGAPAGAVYAKVTPSILAKGIPAAADCVNPDVCTQTEMAAQDVAAWEAALFKALPSGTGYISANTDYNLFDVWVIWRETDADSAAAAGVGKDGCPPHFSVEGAPRCMHFRVGL